MPRIPATSPSPSHVWKPSTSISPSERMPDVTFTIHDSAEVTLSSLCPDLSYAGRLLAERRSGGRQDWSSVDIAAQLRAAEADLLQPAHVTVASLHAERTGRVT